MVDEQFYDKIQERLNRIKYEMDRIFSNGAWEERVIEEKQKITSIIKSIEKSIKNHNLEQINDRVANVIMSYFEQISHELDYIEDKPSSHIEPIGKLLTRISKILPKPIRNTSRKNNSDFEKHTNKTEEFEGTYNQLNRIKNDVVSLNKNIENMNDEISKNFKECQEKYGEISQKIQTTNKAFVELSQMSGSLEEKVNEIEMKLKNKWSKLEEFENEINSLMKQGKEMLGITTIASLAKSYKETRESYDREVKKWQYIFFGSIAIMVLLIIISMFINIDSEFGVSWGLNVRTDSYLSILNSFLLRLSSCIPLVWLAIFASNRRNEEKRLRGEYEHKETLANVYYGYKEQIKDLKDEKAQELAAKLMQNLVEMTNENPNRALDKIKTENIPTIESIEKFLKLSKDFQKLFEKK